MDRTLYFCLSSLEIGEDIIFLRMWEGALKCLFRFLLRSEVTKGLNFILAAGASAMATEGKQKINLKTLTTHHPVIIIVNIFFQTILSAYYTVFSISCLIVHVWSISSQYRLDGFCTALFCFAIINNALINLLIHLSLHISLMVSFISSFIEI